MANDSSTASGYTKSGCKVTTFREKQQVFGAFLLLMLLFFMFFLLP